MRTSVFLVLGLIALQVSTLFSYAVPPGYLLQWSDEFSGSTLNMSNWSYARNGWRNAAYDTSAAVGVSNGCLVITTYTEGGTNFTGFIDTAKKVTNSYGYYEASIQFSNAPGNWSAFWLQSPYMMNVQPDGTLGNTNNNPTNGVEMDIFEHVDVTGSNNKTIYRNGGDHALHWNGYGPAEQSAVWSSGNLGVATGFHTYGLLWTSNGYTFSVDGNVTWSTSRDMISSALQFIRLTSEVNSGGFAGTVPAGGYPPKASSQLKMLVDYVRYYRLYDTPSVFSACTELPGGVAATSAVLRGAVVPNGAGASAWFDWGTTTNYGNQTAPTAAGNTYLVTHVSAAIGGLAPGRIYHCRLSASNGLASIHGRDRIFTTGGRLKAWGDNSLGQTNIPSGLTNVVRIASGSVHGLALKNDGTVVAWGNNSSGQTNVPPDLTDVIGLAAGSLHSVALRADGTVAAWGGNGFGQTNVPAGLTNVVAIAAGMYHNLALRSDGDIVAWGWNQYGQASVPPGLHNVVGVAGGLAFSLALKADGTVAAWGNDTYGQTNVPPGLSNVVAIAAGQFHCLALKSDGTVTAWGRDDKGQTNVPPGLAGVAAIACGQNYCLALKLDGGVVPWGDYAMGQTNLPAGLVNVAQVCGGMNSGYAIASQLPQADSQVATGFENHDLVIPLTGNDPDANPISYRITALPSAGMLYQYAGGSRGNPITAPGAVVNDAGARVIFAPGTNDTAEPYAVFSFVVNDGSYDSVAAQVTVNIDLPAVPRWGRAGWVGGAGGSAGFQLNFSGSTNATYSVWSSTNLLDWNWIETAPEVFPGEYQFLDAAATNWPERYYRISGP